MITGYALRCLGYLFLLVLGLSIEIAPYLKAALSVVLVSVYVWDSCRVIKKARSWIVRPKDDV